MTGPTSILGGCLALGLLCILHVGSSLARDCSGLSAEQCLNYTGWYFIDGQWHGTYKLIRTSCNLDRSLRGILKDSLKLRYIHASLDGNGNVAWFMDDPNWLRAKSKLFGVTEAESFSDDTEGFDFYGEYTAKPSYYTLTHQVYIHMPYPTKRKATLRGEVRVSVYWYGTYQCRSRWRATWTR